MRRDSCSFVGSFLWKEFVTILLKRHGSLTGIFAQVSRGLLPLFLVFLCIPKLPWRNESKKMVCFIISHQLDTT